MEETNTKTMHEIVAEQMGANLPIDWLSDRNKTIIEKMSTALACPRDFSVCAMLTATATILGGKITLSADNHINCPAVWIMLVAPSGIGKSDPVSIMTEPIARKDAAYAREYAQAVADWTANKKQGAEPQEKQIILDNYTPESIGKYLLAGADSLLIATDEIKAFFADFGKYTHGRGGEEDRYLSLIDQRLYKVLRKHDAAIVVPHPCISLIGGIQPARLSSIITGERLHSGLFQRLLVCAPDILHFPEVTPRVDYDFRGEWSKQCEWLFAMPPTAMQISPEAYAAYDYRKISNSQRADKLHTAAREKRANAEKADDRVSMIRKQNMHILRLAMIVHYLGKDVGKADDAGREVITGADMLAAIRLMKVFERDWKKTYKKISAQLTERRQYRPAVLTEAACIKRLFQLHPQMKKADFARLLGVKRQLVSRCAQ